MSSPPRKKVEHLPVWSAWLALGLALSFIVWTAHRRIERVLYVTALGSYLEERGSPDAASPTGFSGNKRELIIPEHNDDSYHLIAQTQQMLATSDWRVRWVDYDNAPKGRAVLSSSLSRWWLGLIAWGDHLATGRHLGLAVEWAALYAQPLLHALALLITVAIVARWFGALPATLLGLGMVLLYPFAADFLPAVPDHRGLAVLCVLWSVLPLGARETGSSEAANQRHRTLGFRFAIAGVAGGLGLWLGLGQQWPVLGGSMLGAILEAALHRRAPSEETDGSTAALWRIWSLAGATTTLGAYLFEYFPSHLWPWKHEVVNPIYALAWLGAGELLAGTIPWLERKRKPFDRVAITRLLAALVVLALPFWWVGRQETGLPRDPLGTQLTNLTDGIVAANFSAWIGRDGTSAALLAAVLPCLWLIPTIGLMVAARRNARLAAALAPAVVVSAIALGLACGQLRWWNALGAVLLALLPAITRVCQQRRQTSLTIVWTTLVLVALGMGGAQLVPSSISNDQTLTVAEVQGLIERNLGYWIAKRIDHAPAIILAPPLRTMSLCYYGGVRGLSTLAWENSNGLAAAVRIASSGKPEEAQALLEQRGVTHIIIPSWDHLLDDYAKIGSSRPEDAFIPALQEWAMPGWLRPVAYPLPKIPGFEQESVTIFEVGADDGEAVSLSRLVEYLVETERMPMAAAVANILKRHTGDLSGLAAQARLALAQNDRNHFQQIIDLMPTAMANGQDAALPFDRQVALGVILAQAKRPDLAQPQIARCLHTATAADLRALPDLALYRFQVVAQALKLEWTNPELRILAQQLLPTAYRTP